MILEFFDKLLGQDQIQKVFGGGNVVIADGGSYSAFSASVGE
jgi:hypothetical protein